MPVGPHLCRPAVLQAQAARLLLRESGDGREAEALLPMRGVLRKRRGGGEDEQERRMSWLFRREAEGERGRKTIPCPASSFRLVAQGDSRPLASETGRGGRHRYSMLMRETFRRGEMEAVQGGRACQSGESHRPGDLRRTAFPVSESWGRPSYPGRRIGLRPVACVSGRTIFVCGAPERHFLKA